MLMRCIVVPIHPKIFFSRCCLNSTQDISSHDHWFLRFRASGSAAGSGEELLDAHANGLRTLIFGHEPMESAGRWNLWSKSDLVVIRPFSRWTSVRLSDHFSNPPHDNGRQLKIIDRCQYIFRKEKTFPPMQSQERVYSNMGYLARIWLLKSPPNIFGNWWFNAGVRYPIFR